MPTKHLDAHIYPSGVLRPTKVRVAGFDPVVAMHQMATDDAVPPHAVVLLVTEGEVVSRFVRTSKGPLRLNEQEATLLTRERDPGKRMRSLGVIARAATCR